jgi:hypothetical protein
VAAPTPTAPPHRNGDAHYELEGNWFCAPLLARRRKQLAAVGLQRDGAATSDIGRVAR